MWAGSCVFYGISLIQRSSVGTTFASGELYHSRAQSRKRGKKRKRPTNLPFEYFFFLLQIMYTPQVQVKVNVTMVLCAVKSPSQCKGRGAGKVQPGLQKHIHNLFKLKTSATCLKRQKTPNVQPLLLFLKHVGSQTRPLYSVIKFKQKPLCIIFVVKLYYTFLQNLQKQYTEWTAQHMHTAVLKYSVPRSWKEHLHTFDAETSACPSK